MSDLTLKAKLLLNNSGFSSGLDDSVKNSEESSGKITSAFKGIGGKIAAVAGFAVIAEGLKDAVSNAVQVTQAGKIQTTTIKNAGLAQDYNTKSLQKSAEAMTELTGQSTQSVMQMQNMMLLSGGLNAELKKSPGYLNQASQVAANLAAASGQNINTVGKALVKTLAAPGATLAGLSRYGVSLTQGQQAQIANLAKQNNILGAQSMLLNDLSKKTKGMAQAATNPLQQLKGTAEVLLTQIGKAILPLVETIAKAITPILKTLLPAIQSIGKELTPLLTMIGKSVGSIIGVVGPLLVSFVKTMAPLLIALLKPIMLIVNAFSGPLEAAFNALLKVIKPIVSALEGGLITAITGILKALMPLMSALAPVISALGGGLLEVLMAVLKAVMPLIAVLGPAFTSLMVQLQPVILAVVGALVKILMALTPILPPLVQLVETALIPLLNLLVTLSPLITDLANIIGDVLSAAITKVMPILTTLVNFVAKIVGWFGTIVTKVPQTLMQLPTKIWNAISGGFNWLVGNIRNIVDNIVGFFAGIPTAIENLAGKVGASAVKFGKTLIQDMVNGITSVIGTVANIASKIWDSIAGWINKYIINPIKDFRISIGPFHGNPFDFLPDVPTFHSGGFVGGPAGANVPAVLQAGEFVMSRDMLRAGSSGSGRTVQFGAGAIVIQFAGGLAKGVTADMVKRVVHTEMNKIIAGAAG